MKRELIKDMTIGAIGGIIGGITYIKIKEKKKSNTYQELTNDINDIFNKEVGKSLLKLIELKELDSTEEVQKEMKQELDYIEFILSKVK